MLFGKNNRKWKKVGQNEQTVRRAWKLKENNMKARFQEGVMELIKVDAPNTILLKLVFLTT